MWCGRPASVSTRCGRRSTSRSRSRETGSPRAVSAPWASAIGAKVGRPDAIVINIDGDGCFQMTMQELATAKMYNIGAIHVVINNGWLGMVRQWQELFHDERFSETDLSMDMPDYCKLADAFGIPTAIWSVAALTGLSGLVVAVRMYETHRPTT